VPFAGWPARLAEHLGDHFRLAADVFRAIGFEQERQALLQFAVPGGLPRVGARLGR